MQSIPDLMTFRIKMIKHRMRSTQTQCPRFQGMVWRQPAHREWRCQTQCKLHTSLRGRQRSGLESPSPRFLKLLLNKGWKNLQRWGPTLGEFSSWIFARDSGHPDHIRQQRIVAHPERCSSIGDQIPINSPKVHAEKYLNKWILKTIQRLLRF